ncbi:uncharacterized protein BO97DRAFT_403185 [Aspergillus homomorphus CBS 101889]|uniref:Uncharacterized protein n=1 Tax=Aspergillus homomorphus (strain CBS 101889) TaxID=1450537 RepID=A0A395I9W6_ASPHC|nr:hypothetical protein BO97DRAFT_403185 [Aspergillus homomorphus CBS 101889]RAL16003.1 hypothetical protein BO97DRAFT_403185 [Aspergillus homomorphus CBS 101889]
MPLISRSLVAPPFFEDNNVSRRVGVMILALASLVAPNEQQFHIERQAIDQPEVCLSDSVSSLGHVQQELEP